MNYNQDWRKILKKQQEIKRKRNKKLGIFSLSALALAATSYFAIGAVQPETVEEPTPIVKTIENTNTQTPIVETIEDITSNTQITQPVKDEPQIQGNLTCHILLHPEGSYNKQFQDISKRVKNFYQQEAGIDITFKQYASSDELPTGLDIHSNLTIVELPSRESLVDKLTELQEKKFNSKIEELETEAKEIQTNLDKGSYGAKGGEYLGKMFNIFGQIKYIKNEMKTIRPKMEKSAEPNIGGTAIPELGRIYLVSGIERFSEPAKVGAKALTHEIGHTLGLGHTHEDPNQSDRLPNGTPNVMSYENHDKSDHGFGLNRHQKEKISLYSEQNLN